MSLINDTKISEGKHVARNSLFTVGTGVLIAALNILFVPIMLHAFGAELYGVLSVTWMVLANLGWLDFGFGRAAARYVSQELAVGRLDRAAVWTWTAVSTQALVGLFGACALSHFAPFVVDQIHVQRGSRELVILTLRLFAFSIPIEFATRSMTGVLQAGQRFDWINSLSVINALSMFAVYGGAVLLRTNFVIVIYGLFAIRILNFFASYWAALSVLPTLNSYSQLTKLRTSYKSNAVVMIKYGSWIAFAAAAGPLLLYFDQWIISIFLGVALLPLYTIPFNALWKLALFPSSLSSTLFPAFSAMEARTEWERINGSFVRANKYLLVALLPILFVLYVWAPEIFRLWIGAGFSAQVLLPFRILVVGYGIALLAPLSGVLLEAVGRPDVLAKLYVVELPFNIAIVWILTKRFGVAGAALSYTLRAVIETVILWIVLYKSVPISGKNFAKGALLRPGFTIVFLAVGVYFIRGVQIGSYFDISATILMLGVYVLLASLFVLDRGDRVFLTSLFGKRRFSAA